MSNLVVLSALHFLAVETIVLGIYIYLADFDVDSLIPYHFAEFNRIGIATRHEMCVKVNMLSSALS